MKIDKTFEAKARKYQKDLIHTKVLPKSVVEIKEDACAFQKLRPFKVKDAIFPLKIRRGESVILDFEDHCTGYLNFELNHSVHGNICDSPMRLRFSFGEFPLEIQTPPEQYCGDLGSGWLQYEERSYVFMPYSGALERRYAFRYLKISRMDNSNTTLVIDRLLADCVSAVEMETCPAFFIPDDMLKKIYDISVKTLKECEQNVFEDGPKRDCRLWIGDLRLQALTDYGTFRNIDLVKRCLYLFAAYRNDEEYVVPCVFPDSPPYVDEWIFSDYSLYFVSCLYDYAQYCDLELPSELYAVAERQIDNVFQGFDSSANLLDGDFFIDWCEGLDKSVAAMGVLLYVLKQFVELSMLLGKPVEKTLSRIEQAKHSLLKHYSEKDRLFVTPNGQISWHSQIWAVLSGVLSQEESRALLIATEERDPEYIMHTPYMVHYYIEALFHCGLQEKAMAYIKTYWGEIVKLGFDCCPEFFNPANHFDSAYHAPEINSACHAWSCTPAYWIKKYYAEITEQKEVML